MENFIFCGVKYMSASIIREYHDNAEDDDKTKIINTAVKLIKKRYLTSGNR